MKYQKPNKAGAESRVVFTVIGGADSDFRRGNISESAFLVLVFNQMDI